MLFKQPKSENWYYEFRVAGERFRKSTETADKNAAKRIERAAKAAAVEAAALAKARALVEGPAAPDDKAPMLFGDAALKWYEFRGQNLKRPDQREQEILWLVEQLGADKPIAEITTADVVDLVARRRVMTVRNPAAERGRALEARGLKPKRPIKRPRKALGTVSARTVNHGVVDRLRTVLNFARKAYDQKVKAIEWGECKQEEPGERIATVKREQAAALRRHLAERYVVLVYVKARLGPRISELLNLKWTDCDFENERFEFTVKSRKKETVQTKPMPSDVRAALSLLPRRGAYVFTHDDGRRITYAAARSAWNRACEKADVTGRRLHDLRHTAATNLLSQTGNLKLVQKMLGHADIRSTLRYAHADDRDLRAALEHGVGPAFVAPAPPTGAGSVLFGELVPLPSPPTESNALKIKA